MGGPARPALWTVIALLLAGVVGCGAPEYQYVTNSADRTYLRIPSSWRPFEQHQLDAVFGIDPAMSAADVGVWHVAYDAADVPSMDHVVGWSATDPAVVVAVRQVPPGARGQLSLDRLRDMFLPVSDQTRQLVAQDPLAAAGYTDFALFADEVLAPGGGLHGVHVVYRYAFGGLPPQTLDQTVYVNDDASRIYLLLVRCTTTCYADRHEEISRVVSSFTVRGSR